MEHFRRFLYFLLLWDVKALFTFVRKDRYLGDIAGLVPEHRSQVGRNFFAGEGSSSWLKTHL